MRGFIQTDIKHYLPLFQTKLRKHVSPSPKCRRDDNCGANHLLLLSCNLPSLLRLPPSCLFKGSHFSCVLLFFLDGGMDFDFDLN